MGTQKTITRHIKLQDGGELDVLDMNLGEFNNLQESYQAGDYKRVKTIFLGIVKSWDIVDRKGEPVPLTSDGMDLLTMRQLKQMTKAFYSVILDDEPKND
jgi:hypothetical protein